MTLTLRINAAGLALVKQREGLRTKVYRDVAGIGTVCYGHTSKDTSLTITTSLKTCLRRSRLNSAGGHTRAVTVRRRHC